MPMEQTFINRIVPILKSYGVVRASIFGSFARGEQGPGSDVDILIQPPKGMTLLDKGGLYMDLKEALHRDVDLVEYDYIKPRLRESILSGKIDIL